MKKLFTICAILFCTFAMAQSPTGTKTRFPGIWWQSKDTAAATTADSIAMLANRGDTSLYFRWSNVGRWNKLAYSSTAAGFIDNQIGSNLIAQSAKFRVSDTGWARIFSAPKFYGDSLQATGSGGAGLYTNGGSLVAAWGGGGGTQFVTYGFSGYNSNLGSGYTARSFTDKNYVDSSVALRLRISDTATMLSGYKTYYPRKAIGYVYPMFYDNTTGLISLNQVKNFQDGYLDSVNFKRFKSKIDSGAITAVSPIFYNSVTNVISSNQANSSQNGYLSSTDWSTFNSKLSSISVTTANGVSATSSGGTTPSLTFTLGNITPTSASLSGNLTSTGYVRVTQYATIGTYDGGAPVEKVSNYALTLGTANGATDHSLYAYGSVDAAGGLGGTLTTAAQPNITSVGALTGLNISGNGVPLVLNSTNSNNYKIQVQDNGTNRLFIGANSTNAMEIANGSVTQVATINATTGAYTATSDSIAKKNITDAPLALPNILKIKIRSYDWKESGIHEPYGVIAQELYQVTPTYVYKPLNNSVRWGVQKSEMVPMLIKAVQEQQLQIDNLRAQLDELKAILIKNGIK